MIHTNETVEHWLPMIKRSTILKSNEFGMRNVESWWRIWKLGFWLSDFMAQKNNKCTWFSFYSYGPVNKIEIVFDNLYFLKYVILEVGLMMSTSKFCIRFSPDAEWSIFNVQIGIRITFRWLIITIFHRSRRLGPVLDIKHLDSDSAPEFYRFFLKPSQYTISF